MGETLKAESSLAELVSGRGCLPGVRALAAQVAKDSPTERADLFRVLGTRGAVEPLPEAAALYAERSSKIVALSSLPCVSHDSSWLELQLKSWRAAIKWIDTSGGGLQDPVALRLEVGIRPMLQRRVDEANRLRIELSRAAAVTDPRAAAWVETISSRQRAACDVGQERGRHKIVRDMALRISRDHKQIARNVRHAMARSAIVPADSPQLDDAIPLVQQEVERLEEQARVGPYADVDSAYVEAELRMMTKTLAAIGDSILPAVQSPEVIEALAAARDRLEADLEMARTVAGLLERMNPARKRTASRGN